MKHIDPLLEDAITARQDGRTDEALRILMKLWVQAGDGRVRAGASEFIIMFQWEQLAEQYLPARDALAGARDEQMHRLLSGDENFSVRDRGSPRSRFQVIVDMNETLEDSRATYELFLQLESLFPALARREASRALPAIVEAGDFTLAERYMANTLDLQDHLAHLNHLSRDFALFPQALRAPPRLAAELSGFMRAVMLRAAVLHGTGRKSKLRSCAMRR